MDENLVTYTFRIQKPSLDAFRQEVKKSKGKNYNKQIRLAIDRHRAYLKRQRLRHDKARRVIT